MLTEAGVVDAGYNLTEAGVSNLTCFSCGLDFRYVPWDGDHPCLGWTRPVATEYLVLCGAHQVSCQVSPTSPPIRSVPPAHLSGQSHQVSCQVSPTRSPVRSVPPAQLSDQTNQVSCQVSPTSPAVRSAPPVLQSGQNTQPTCQVRTSSLPVRSDAPVQLSFRPIITSIRSDLQLHLSCQTHQCSCQSDPPFRKQKNLSVWPDFKVGRHLQAPH